MERATKGAVRRRGQAASSRLPGVALPEERRSSYRRKAEALRESVANTRAMIDCALDAVIGIDSEGTVFEWNGQAEAILGWSAEEAIGRRLAELIVPPELREAHTKGLARVRDGGEPHILNRRIEVEGVHRDGRRLPVELAVTRLQSGGAPAYCAFVRDISDRKRRDDALVRYAERLATLHQIDRAILAGQSAEETVNWALERLCAGLPCDRAAVVGFGAAGEEAVMLGATGLGSDVTPAGSRHPAQRALGTFGKLRSGQVFQVRELSAPAPGAPLVQALFELGLRAYAATPMRVADELVGVLTVWSRKAGGLDRDQQEVMLEVADQLAVAIRQARLMEQVRAHAEELEARVEERTREIEERSEELQAFAYSVSHDLRAPLRAMQGFGQALIEDYGEQLDPIAADFTRRIVEAAGHMDALIQDLLAYSRISRAQLTLQAVPLNDVLDEALRQLQRDIAERRATVTVDVGGLDVLGHGPTLIQITTNLLGNALKFVPGDRKPFVRASAARRGEVVRFCVEDNGIGIEPQHQERIFGIFERLHGMDEYPGTGIGLAIVRKAAERLGGTVGVESRPGEGSTFWVELQAA